MSKKKKKKVQTKIVYRDVHDVETLPPQRFPGSTGARDVNDVTGFLSGLRDVMQQATEGKVNGKALPPPPTADGIDPLDPEVQKQSVSRLVTLFKTLGEKPEPIRDLLHRAGIPWELKTLEDTECIVIQLADLEAGDARLQEQGSIAQRVYGDTIGGAMSPSRSRIDPEAGPESDPEWMRTADENDSDDYVVEEPPVFEHDSVQLQCDNGQPPSFDDDDFDLGKVQG